MMLTSKYSIAAVKATLKCLKYVGVVFVSKIEDQDSVRGESLTGTTHISAYTPQFTERTYSYEELEQ